MDRQTDGRTGQTAAITISPHHYRGGIISSGERRIQALVIIMVYTFKTWQVIFFKISVGGVYYDVRVIVFNATFVFS